MQSKGPTSPSGRAKVARNSLKHGLTGRGIVVLDEDLPIIEERFVQFTAELNPLGVVSEFLLRHLVLNSVRMDRAARHEAAAVNKKMLLVQQAETNLARREVRSQVDRLVDEPESACRELEASPPGIAWMISAWEHLKATLLDADRERWGLAQIERAENLSGRRLEDPSSSRIVVLSGASLGHLENFADWPELPAAGRSDAARGELARIIDSEIARLEGLRDHCDHAGPAKDQADALALALFDASKEAVLARKYAAAAERAFFKALKTIQELNAQATANATAEAETVNPETTSGSADLALNFPATPVLEGTPKRRPPAPADRPKSKGRRSNRDPRRLQS